MSRRPTVSDVAELAGVHRSTAARALNPTTSGLLTRETVARVLDAAQRLQYTPNTIARGLRTSRSSTIGVLIPDLTNPLFPPILRGVEEAIMPLGYTALIVNTDNDPERETANFHALLARQVDGLIVATARQHDPMLDEATRRGVAVVLVNRGTGSRQFPLVAGDDREGVRDAVAHLVGLGHGRIAHLAGPSGVSTATVRASAFREAVAEHGLASEAAPVVGSDGYTEQGGADSMRQVLDSHPGTTAVLAGNDLIALGALRALQARGLRCPQDVSVVGFNDMRFADALSPALTTVRVPHRLLGFEAARLLLERIGTPDTPSKTLLLPCELVVRESTAPPAA
ncbi:LacI family DNA-binding transcriptional regulator [Pseudonocardia sp.]|uniref:LacI family DNA-binding transcriptional regulator n=1 Tax=Pseudonocardia sp. TaxID=60912 RepID=UPI0031FC1117